MNYSREIHRHMGSMCCGPGLWSGRSRARFRLNMGILLILIGMIWLGVRMGWIELAWLHTIPVWPVIVIMVGVCLIYRGLRTRRPVESESSKEN